MNIFGLLYYNYYPEKNNHENLTICPILIHSCSFYLSDFFGVVHNYYNPKYFVRQNYNVNTFYIKEFFQILSNVRLISSSVILAYTLLHWRHFPPLVISRPLSGRIWASFGPSYSS